MVTSNTTFALLGATRGIGRVVLERALERGHAVRALVREGSTLDIAHPNLTILRGDATDAKDVARALEGATAVLSAIGTPPREKTPFRTLCARATLEAMRHSGVQRLVAVSVYGAGETRALVPFFTRAVIFPFYLRRVMADHETQEAIIKDSGVEWTLIRPPYLTDGPATADYASAFGTATQGLTWKISRADVAHCMLDALERHVHVRAAIGLSYRKASTAAA
jgi:putative NADH-flavin reductase